MDFLAVLMSMLIYFAWGYLVSPGNRFRQFEVAGPESHDPLAERLPRTQAEHGPTTTPARGRVGKQATPGEVATADPVRWTSLDEHQLNRLLKESSSS